MPDRRLAVVAARPTWPGANVIDCTPGFEGPYLRGAGEDNLVCGQCGTILVAGIVEAMLTLYLCCPECGHYNRAECGTETVLA